MVSRTIRVVLVACTLATVTIVPRPSQAGPFLDWLFHRRPVYYPVGAPVAAPAGGAACVAPAIAPGSMYPQTPPVIARYAPAAYPMTAYAPAAPIVANYAPTYPAANLAPLGYGPGYLPRYIAVPSYETTWGQVPVTQYRPVTTVNPLTATPQVSLQPCTTYEWQARSVPYSAFRPIRGLFGSTYYANPPAAVAVPTYSSAPYVAPAYGYTAPGYAYSLPSTVLPDATTSASTPACCPPTSTPSSNTLNYGLGYPDQTPSTSNAPSAGFPDSGSTGPTAPLNSEPANQRPSLRGDLEVAPSASIRAPGRPNYAASIDAGSPPEIYADPQTKNVDDNPRAGNKFPWGTSNAGGESASPRSQAQPIPDPDKAEPGTRSITPPRLLNPNDRTVARPLSSQVVPAVWSNTEPRPMPQRPTAPKSTRRPVMDDSGWQSLAK